MQRSLICPAARKKESFKTRVFKRRMIRFLEKTPHTAGQNSQGIRNLTPIYPGLPEAYFHPQRGFCLGQEMFEGRKVSNRVVSIDRHYICFIEREKEIKSVEFGAKVNNIQMMSYKVIILYLLYMPSYFLGIFSRQII